MERKLIRKKIDYSFLLTDIFSISWISIEYYSHLYLYIFIYISRFDWVEVGPAKKRNHPESSWQASLLITGCPIFI